MYTSSTARRGFTLIELSIVLVIIGLIVGGVLVGQNLIAAAGVRAQISQIEKYNTAVNTFRGKYDCLPGDCANAAALGFGGSGNGDGLIEQYTFSYCGGCGGVSGEPAMFWVELSANGYIDGTFNTASYTYPGSINVSLTSSPGISAYFPAAKIGQGNYIYVWSGGVSGIDGNNYFTVSAVTNIGASYLMSSATGLTVVQAYNIDTKIDDGLPQSGKVTAMMIGGGANEPNWVGGASPYYNGTYPGNPAWASVTTCYDNGNNAANLMKYSLEENGGVGMNCALSFQFQ